MTRWERLNRWLKSVIRNRELVAEGDMSDCSWYRGTGTCSFGCWEEPRCQTDCPMGGWPLDRPWFPRASMKITWWWRRLRCKHEHVGPVTGITNPEAEGLDQWGTVYWSCWNCNKKFDKEPK